MTPSYFVRGVFLLAVKFKTARFDARFGPKSLFDRIQFKMKDQHAFTLSKHCKQRIDERAVPMEVIVDAKQFDARQWKLVQAEVRTDKGKFVNSVWVRDYGGELYQIVVGFTAIETIIAKKQISRDPSCERGGQLYDFVDSVNAKLNVEDGVTPPN